MTAQSLDLESLHDIQPVVWRDWYESDGEPAAGPTGEHDDAYQPYRAGVDHVPPFVPVGNSRHQVRLNASTHDEEGLIRKATPAALANTRRLTTKITSAVERFNRYRLDEDEAARVVVVTYGITTGAAREAVAEIRRRGESAALLVLESLVPIPHDVRAILARYPHVVVAEENAGGLLAEMLFGLYQGAHVRRINAIGAMIQPDAIVREVERCLKTS